MTLTPALSTDVLNHLYRNIPRAPLESLEIGLLDAALNPIAGSRRSITDAFGPAVGKRLPSVQSIAFPKALATWSAAYVAIYASDEVSAFGRLAHFAETGNPVVIAAGVSLLIKAGNLGVQFVGVEDGIWSGGERVGDLPPPWTPIELENLFLWFDFRDDETLGTTDAGLSVVVETDPVGYAEDPREGNTRHVKQATAGSRPLYAGVNGVNFDGTSDHLDTPSYAEMDTRARTYFQVVDVPVLPGARMTMTEQYTTGATGEPQAPENMSSLYVSGTVFAFFGRKDTAPTNISATVLRTNVAERAAIIAEWQNDGTIRVTVNSLENTGINSGALTTPGGHVFQRVGAWNPNGAPGNFWPGSILMHGCVLGDITLAERTELLSYLNKVATGEL